MHRFYAPDIETSMLLPDEEAQHCVRVLRLAVGEQIEVVDGKGNLFLCEIATANNKSCGKYSRKGQHSASLGLPHNGRNRSDEKYGPLGMDG